MKTWLISRYSKLFLNSCLKRLNTEISEQRNTFPEIFVVILPSAGGELHHGMNISIMCMFLCFIGVCCGGELHGRLHWTAGEAERLRGRGDGDERTGRGARAASAGGRPGVWVDGELPPGKNFCEDADIVICHPSLMLGVHTNCLCLDLSLLLALVWVHGGVGSGCQGPLAQRWRRLVALLCCPHSGSMSGQQLLCRENVLLGAALWPGLHSSSVRVSCGISHSKLHLWLFLYLSWYESGAEKKYSLKNSLLLCGKDNW